MPDSYSRLRYAFAKPVFFRRKRRRRGGKENGKIVVIRQRRSFLTVEEEKMCHMANHSSPYVGKEGGEGGGDAHRLTFPLVSPLPCGHFKTTQ